MEQSLACDSSLVINAIRNHSLVPWILRNQWENCLLITRSLNFSATHVFRKGNNCADTLANFGLALSHLTIWLHALDNIRESFVKNKLEIPNFRSINF